MLKQHPVCSKKKVKYSFDEDKVIIRSGLLYYTDVKFRTRRKKYTTGDQKCTTDLQIYI